jgi:ribosomal protein L32
MIAALEAGAPIQRTQRSSLTFRRADSAHATPNASRCAKCGIISMASRLQIRIGMKKSTHKLSLRAQTIRLLNNNTLGLVAGGNAQPAEAGFIMRDSVIVQTGFIMQDTVIVPTGRR